MATVLFCGMAVVDFVFEVDEMPSRAEKYRASGAQVLGGGCAATAAVACARLGGFAQMAGRVGADQIGDLIRDGLEREAVDCRMLLSAPGARSAYSSILIDRAGERQIVNFRGEGLPIAPDWIEPGAVDGVLADSRWAEGALHALGAARAVGAPGVLDAEAPTAPEIAAAASHVAFSRQGLLDFTAEAEFETALRKAALALPGWVGATDGARGTFWVEGGAIQHEPAPKVFVADTLGAGDVWHGAFTLRLAEGADERTAVRFANATAALKCQAGKGRDGAPSRAETETLLERMN